MNINKISWNSRCSFLLLFFFWHSYYWSHYETEMYIFSIHLFTNFGLLLILSCLIYPLFCIQNYANPITTLKNYHVGENMLLSEWCIFWCAVWGTWFGVYFAKLVLGFLLGKAICGQMIIPIWKIKFPTQVQWLPSIDVHLQSNFTMSFRFSMMKFTLHLVPHFYVDKAVFSTLQVADEKAYCPASLVFNKNVKTDSNLITECRTTFCKAK